MSAGNKNGEKVVMSRSDYITESENESLKLILDDALCAYRRAKRKHEPFNVEKVTQEIWYSDKTPVREIVDRVAKVGDKADTRNVHFAYKDKMREEFRDYLVGLGYNQDWATYWVFGYRKE
ncbi:MAG: hypothetical protein VZR53_10140 [Prevotella sp.]|nr:hypothetical protein [Prevotella sp.]